MLSAAGWQEAQASALNNLGTVCQSTGRPRLAADSYGRAVVIHRRTGRLTGQAVVRYDWTPDRLQFVLGAAYINRINRSWLPVAGVVGLLVGLLVTQPGDREADFAAVYDFGDAFGTYEWGGIPGS